MKVILKREDKTGKIKKEEINIDGNTIMPWYINVLSIELIEGGLEFFLLEDYDLKRSFNPDKLWIIGKNKRTITQQIEDGVPSNAIDFPRMM